MNALTRTAATTAVRVSRPAVLKQQNRGIVNWLTNYPDKVMAKKKVQMLGGTKLGEKGPTWLKQPGDLAPLGFGVLLVGYGMFNAVIGVYQLSTGKGKLS